MIFLTSNEIDRMIEEDIPVVDITTEILGLTGDAKITFISRESGLICGTEEVDALFKKLDISTDFMLKSGSLIEKNQQIIVGIGDVKALHKAWKISLNLLEYMSGIASSTHRFVNKAKSVNPYVSVATTRKHLPFTKKLMIKAIMIGGAVSHRMSLSDTILIFKQHMMFKAFEEIIKELNMIKSKLGNKDVGIEVEDKEQAKKAIDAGFDFVQLDKCSIEDLEEVIKYKDAVNPSLLIAVAGGINFDNVDKYAKTGVNIIVTSSLYWAKPLDITAKIEPI